MLRALTPLLHHHCHQFHQHHHPILPFLPCYQNSAEESWY
uniref:Uncharacterized protein n=1 Tax=Rhizophora mucronata TaxID=61149 RepID=A0A2P2K617_RHIMU